MAIDFTHAVVTGGGSGIGEAIAKALLDQGLSVTIMGRSLDRLEQAASKLQTPDRLFLQTCDVTSPEAVTDAFAAATEHFGAIDILVNCAGAAPTKPFHKLSADDWNWVMNVNLNGVFNCTRAAIDVMRERKAGRIINIASTASQVGYAYVSAYCAAKHGVLGLTRALALETAGLGVTVNAICPGYTDTDIIRDSVKNIVEKTGRSEEEALKTFTKTNPQGRLIDPTEVASTVVWLSAEESRSITGQAISVSGGEVM